MGRMLFLIPKQQCQSTEGIVTFIKYIYFAKISLFLAIQGNVHLKIGMYQIQTEFNFTRCQVRSSRNQIIVRI